MEKTKSSEEGEKIMAKSNVDVHQLAKDVKDELNLLRDEVLKYEVDAQLAKKAVIAAAQKIKILEDINAKKEVEERKKQLEAAAKKSEQAAKKKSEELVRKEAEARRILEATAKRKAEELRKAEAAARKKAEAAAKKAAEKSRREAKKRAEAAKKKAAAEK